MKITVSQDAAGWWTHVHDEDAIAFDKLLSAVPAKARAKFLADKYDLQKRSPVDEDNFRYSANNYVPTIVYEG